MLVSPAEPSALKALGEVSPLPEKFGADFLFVTKQGLVAVQRKEVADLVASVRGDRMGRLLSDMACDDIKQAVMLIEGPLPWEGGRRLFGGYSFGEWESFEVKIQQMGCILVRTASLEATATRLARLETHFLHGDPDTLLRVPKAKAPARLRPLMALPGVNLTKARSLDEAGIHLEWSCTQAEVEALKGWGRVSAAKLGEHVPFREESNGNSGG